jgi:hypothetical protein
MLFFRSEERVREWCSSTGHPLRPLVKMDQLWELAREWYSTRLQPDSRRPQPGEMRQILGRLGLVGDFWDPQSDVFGERASGPTRSRS